PEESARARAVIRDRDEVVERARTQAERVLERAQTEREQQLSKTEIVQAASREADRMIAEAEAVSRRIKAEAESYVEGKLATFEVVLQKTLAAVERGRARLGGRLEQDELSTDELDLRLEALVDGIHVSGTIRVAAAVECRRCLKVTEAPLHLDLEETFLYPGEGEADEPYRVVDEQIDLEPAVRDAVMLALPLNPLCTDACRGLCTTCGADRKSTRLN